MSQTTPQVIASFRSYIWNSLDNGLYATALFTAERLHAYDPKGADSVHLYALCLWRDGQFQQAEALTKNWLRHVGCAYIYAQCCLKLGGGRENLGINALEGCKRLWSSNTSWNQSSDTERKVMPDAPSIYCVIGLLWQSLGDVKKATEAFVQSIKGNPFNWEAFKALCDTGKYKFCVNLRVNNIFKQSPEMLEALKLPISQSEGHVRPKNTAENQSNHTSSDPFAASSRDRSDLAYNNHPSFLNRLNEGMTGSASNVAQMETPTAQSANSSTHDLLGGSNGVPDKPPPVRKTRTAAADIGSRKLTSRNLKDETKRSNSSAEPSVPAAPARRSTRLNTLKFASKLSGERETRLASKERDREAKKRAVSTRNRSGQLAAEAKEREKDRGSSEDINMSDAASRTQSTVSTTKPQIDTKKEEAQHYLLDMYKKFGNAYFNLVHFRCQEAVQALSSLPTSQRETPWVMCQVAKAQYEMANYVESEKIFLKVRAIDPVRTKDMEVFSTVLWHQRKEVELSFLAHELIDLDRLAPEAWCALGNCFSLQREHDQALKCFKKATQIDPKLAYAFTLQGHEHISNEEYDKALVSYRGAISVDSRHYNAWYGLGKVYEKMGKYDIAEKHFRTAAKINPTNAVLVCCIGMVLEKMKDHSGALVQYTNACKISPKSAMSRFKKARTLMTLGNFNGALDELQVLKDLVPDEANVHFLLGRVYKTLRNKPDAIKHLTIALNLDPKAGHLIKEVIENLDDDEEDAYLAEDSDVYRLLDGDH
ncbi:hypothetical protein EDC01DRAFT_620031 [Geopyxis carbonaria]|nr:hypothetical protein EDC01DRAFT_620031 [Geopyxis carbonaria]